MNKALNFIAENNIQPEALFALVDKVQRMDLNDEASIRKVIQSVAELANRRIDKVQEDRIVREILKNGVNEKLFEML
jgi:hypothetical protein